MTDDADLLIHSPSDGRLIGKVARSTGSEVRQAVARARAAQADWGSRSPGDRADRLRRVRERVLSRADDLAEGLGRETGAPRPAALTQEVGGHLEALVHLPREVERVLAPSPLPLRLLPHRAATSQAGPAGVAAVLGGGGLAVTYGAVAMALLAGNAVVLASPDTLPTTAALARQIYVEGGLPAELLQVVHGGRELHGLLLDSGPDVAAVAGPAGVVRAAAARCGELLLPCRWAVDRGATAVVLGDADPTRTVELVVEAAFTGASWFGALREVHVEDRAYDAFVAALVARVSRLRGPPHAEIAPLPSPPALRALEERIAAALVGGATVAAGGRRLEGPGQHHAPTVLLGGDGRALPDAGGPALRVRRLASEGALPEVAGQLYVYGGDGAAALRRAEGHGAALTVVNHGPLAHLAAEHAWGGSEEALLHFCRRSHVNVPSLPWLAPLVTWLPRGDVDAARRRLTRLYGRGLARLRG